MNKKSINLLLLTIISAALISLGCSKPEPTVIYKTKEVKVPIYQKIEVPYRQFPYLLTDNLTTNSSHKEVLKAYYIDHLTLISELEYFRGILYLNEKENKNEAY